jgi:diguanylate cyclase (GGDEF)-like protein/putative nucleotidyltransferase with HDIG domain
VTKVTRFYWLAIVVSGFALLAYFLLEWKSSQPDLVKLFLYLLAVVLTSGFKVWLPGVLSTLSMNYVFMIAALMDLNIGSAILVGIAGVLGQTFYKSRAGANWNQLLFNLSTISLSIMVAAYCYRLHLLASVDPYGIFSVVLSSASYFMVNTMIVSGIISLTSKKRVFPLWKESYLWTSPQYLVGGLIACGFHFLLQSIGWIGTLSTIPVMYLVYRSYKIYLTRVDEQQSHLAEMAELHLRTIEALALAIDAKDDTTAAHLRRVQIYASEIGKELELSSLEMQALEAAALLYDIGKLAVPEYIISKPGKLTPDEFEKMKIHPIVGAEILERVNFPYPVVPIVRAHHEKFDGTGYPDGLKGEEIPIGARILSVVDCLDALASDRQYRKAMQLDDAMMIIVAQAGQAFDPKIVSVMQRRYRELEAKAKNESFEPAKNISYNVKVERGSSPATGFAVDPIVSNATVPSNKNFQMRISDARREFQMLVEIANDLGASLSLRETLALLAIRLEESIAYDSVAIYVREKNELVPKYVKGEGSRLFSSLRIPVGQGLSGWVAENNLPIVNGNPAVECGYLNDPSKVTLLRSAIAVPLRCRDQVVGVLTLYQLQPDAFTVDHKRILLNISAKAGAVIENAVKFEQVQGEARMDELTGLMNARSLFEELEKRVASCASDGTDMAVLVLDLDGFKLANDLHGHLTGDKVLQSVAAALRRNCRATDLVARWGGDEFILVLAEPQQHLARVLERIAEVGAAAGLGAGCTTPLGLSAGCAIYPDDATDAESLLEKADERMYEEKRKRKAANPQPPRNVVVLPKSNRSEGDAPRSRVQEKLQLPPNDAVRIS